MLKWMVIDTFILNEAVHMRNAHAQMRFEITIYRNSSKNHLK